MMLKFVWPTARPHLRACGVLINSSAIESWLPIGCVAAETTVGLTVDGLGRRSPDNRMPLRRSRSRRRPVPLVVLPSVLAAGAEFERFVMAYLSDATFMRRRIGQRVTQALGPANRSSDDWAMSPGLSPGFGTN